MSWKSAYQIGVDKKGQYHIVTMCKEGLRVCVPTYELLRGVVCEGLDDIVDMSEWEGSVYERGLNGKIVPVDLDEWIYCRPR